MGKVKATLKVSTLLNVCFAACLVWVLVGTQIPQTPAPEKHESAKAALLETSATTSLESSFRWSQLESSDYRVYVANLRLIGCPERTLRDIIEADVESLYSARRRELHSPENDSGPWSRREAVHLVAFLLGAGPAAEQAELADKPVESHPDAVAQLRVPLVLRTLDTSSLELAPEQLEAIAQLREEFLKRFGALAQNIADPAYRELWEKAQPEIDDALAGTIGRKAYLELESAAGADNASAE
jgi:hypothetical protein